MSVYVINFISRWHNLQNLKYLGHGGFFFISFVSYMLSILFFKFANDLSMLPGDMF